MNNAQSLALKIIDILSVNLMKTTQKSPYFNAGMDRTCYNKDTLTITKLDIIIINILWQPGIMALVIRRPLLISKSCLYLSKLMF